MVRQAFGFHIKEPFVPPHVDAMEFVFGFGEGSKMVNDRRLIGLVVLNGFALTVAQRG